MHDMVFVRVGFYNYVIRFKWKGKLTPRFVGPFKILKHVSKVAYWVLLLTSMKYNYNMFHVSLLHKYISDSSHVLGL